MKMFPTSKISGVALAAALAMFGPAALAGQPRYESLVLSDMEGGTKAKQSFVPTTPKLFIMGKLADVPSGSKVKAVWIAEKTKVAPPDYQIATSILDITPLMNEVTFSMSKPNAGWPTGSYRVDLFIDDKPASTIRFSVAP
jgi:hypothetical protein